MSLILLFLPHGAPVNIQTVSPAVIYEIQTVTPSLSFIENLTPSLTYAQKALGEFENSNVEYNSSTVEYSSSTETYGGMDRLQAVASTLFEIDNAKPFFYSIDTITPAVYDINKI